ncbi:MAG: hypothetical protein HC902_06970 [Calothrix sp. SM1_5_4]|nr:hypothetical protein [Calothrix sp. SM1_5_4]
MKFLFAAFALLVTLANPAAEALDGGDFQTLQRDNDFAELMKQLDLNCSTCALEYKNTGTSVGIKAAQGNTKLGKWVPRNSATNPEAQVVSYHLGRFLHMSENVMPSAYYRLTGGALATFRDILASANERNRWRRVNRDDILKAIAATDSATGLKGVFTPKLAGDSLEVTGLANPSANTINSSHPIARFIRADGPMPSGSKRIGLAGVKKKSGEIPSETELELARQFSKIMVLDMLTGQWDRWSGGNVEASWSGTRVYFLARDNGGASMAGGDKIAKYSKIVTRFDRAQILRVRRLVEALSSVNEAPRLMRSLNLASKPSYLLARAKAVLAHVQAVQASYGAEAFFAD